MCGLSVAIDIHPCSNKVSRCSVAGEIHHRPLLRHGRESIQGLAPIEAAVGAPLTRHPQQCGHPLAAEMAHCKRHLLIWDLGNYVNKEAFLSRPDPKTKGVSTTGADPAFQRDITDHMGKTRCL